MRLEESAGRPATLDRESRSDRSVWHAGKSAEDAEVGSHRSPSGAAPKTGDRNNDDIPKLRNGKGVQQGPSLAGSLAASRLLPPGLASVRRAGR